MNYKTDIEVRGGLGDLFIRFQHSTAWEELEALGPGERARVVVISHNPFCEELFRWHPKREQIDLVLSSSFIMEYDNKDLRRSVGVPETMPPERPARDPKPIRVYPSPDDLALLEYGLPKKPFIAIAPTASGMEIENRDIPLQAILHICAAARVVGVPVVFLGRTYHGPHAPKHREKRPSGPGVVDFTDRLSVPGTIEVVKRCAAAVCAHSAILQIVWVERKPNFVLYPPKYEWHDFKNPSPFAFGKDFPETTRMLFNEFRPNVFFDFLKKHFNKKDGKP